MYRNRTITAGADWIGIGGEVSWRETSPAGACAGAWTCRQCGTQQQFKLTAGSSQWFHCTNPACCNYGYISTGLRN